MNGADNRPHGGCNEVPTVPDTRRDMRTPITLKIKFKSSNLEQFIERYSVDVSRGGIFIRTKEPLPVGTQLRFEFQLQDASSLIAGDGTVVWIREHDPARQGVAPGMGVKFDRLAAESQKVLDKILAEKQKRGDAQLESRFDAGVRASASASGTLSTVTPRPRDDFSGGDSKVNTPLPGAVPGLESPGDEFGNESTRVMQNELVRSLADRTRGHDEAHNAFSDPEPTRKASVEELKLAVQGSAVEKSGDSIDVKQEAKVEIAPEASKPEPVVELKADAKKPEAIKEEPKPAVIEAKKDEPKPAVVEAKKDEPKLALVESKPEAKKEEPKAVDPKTKKAEPKVEPKKEEAKPAVAAAAPPPKSSSVWLVYTAVVLVAVAGAYTLVRSHNNSEEQPTTPPPVAQPAPTPPPAAQPTPTPPPAAQPTPTEAANPPQKEPAATPDKEPAAAAAGLSVPVTSDPPGAMITVDGKPLPEPTPTTLGGLDVKKIYDVRVALKGFHEWKVKLKPKTGDKLDAALVPNEKIVEVATTPAGAEVVLDGKRVGKTPFTIHKLDLTKAHALELKRTGFVSQTRSISATDTFESKGDKDVLAVAMTLEAAPNVPAPPKPHPVAVKKPAPKKPSDTTSPPSDTAPATAEKPTEAATPSEKPAAPTDKAPTDDKAAADKPAAPTDKAPASDKPAEKPKSKPEGDTSAAPAADAPQQ